MDFSDLIYLVVLISGALVPAIKGMREAAARRAAEEGRAPAATAAPAKPERSRGPMQPRPGSSDPFKEMRKALHDLAREAAKATEEGASLEDALEAQGEVTEAEGTFRASMEDELETSGVSAGRDDLRVPGVGLDQVLAREKAGGEVALDNPAVLLLPGTFDPGELHRALDVFATRGQSVLIVASPLPTEIAEDLVARGAERRPELAVVALPTDPATAGRAAGRISSSTGAQPGAMGGAGVGSCVRAVARRELVFLSFAHEDSGLAAVGSSVLGGDVMASDPGELTSADDYVPTTLTSVFDAGAGIRDELTREGFDEGATSEGRLLGDSVAATISGADADTAWMAPATTAGWRQALIAREVLGPPTALRKHPGLPELSA